MQVSLGSPYISTPDFSPPDHFSFQPSPRSHVTYHILNKFCSLVVCSFVQFSWEGIQCFMYLETKHHTDKTEELRPHQSLKYHKKNLTLNEVHFDFIIIIVIISSRSSIIIIIIICPSCIMGRIRLQSLLYLPYKVF